MNDPVGDGRRFLLETFDGEVRQKLERNHPILDEPDPMLEAIERDDEHFRLESREWDR